MERDNLKVYQAQKTQKNQVLGKKKTRQVSPDKYFKISLIYFEMVSTQNLFGFEQIETDSRVDATLIFEEINNELEEYLLEKSIDTDSTDGVFDFLEALNNHIQEDFDELIGEDTTDKKQFIKALMDISALLLNTKVYKTDKIKRIFKIAI